MKMKTILLLAALALCIVESKKFTSKKSATNDGGACGVPKAGYYGKQSDCYGFTKVEPNVDHGMNHKFCCSFPLIDLSELTKSGEFKRTMAFDNKVEELKAKKKITDKKSAEGKAIKKELTELRAQTKKSKVGKQDRVDDEEEGGRGEEEGEEESEKKQKTNPSSPAGAFCWKLFRCWATEYECIGDYTESKNVGLVPCIKEYDGCYTRRRTGTCKRSARFEFESYEFQKDVVAGKIQKAQKGR
jgi:hypothetical protein